MDDDDDDDNGYHRTAAYCSAAAAATGTAVVDNARDVDKPPFGCRVSRDCVDARLRDNLIRAREHPAGHAHTTHVTRSGRAALGPRDGGVEYS